MKKLKKLKTETKRLETDYDRLFDLYDQLKRDIVTVRSCGNDHLLKLKRQHKANEELKTKVESLEDAIKSQNEAIEENKKEAHRANDRLTMVLRRLQHLGVWKNEESEKQADEMQEQAKKAFKVGDKVVINEKAKGLYGFQIEAMHTQTPLTIRKVIDSQPKGYECEYLDNHVGTFPAKWLNEHAPEEQEKEKALEWGSIVITLCDCDEVKAGEKVVVLKHYENGDIDAVTKEGVTCCYDDSEYKPL
tara:strand:+ start:635 stop:1375 length:741 start_codon:yes stop_codon:yes gene_type:complete